MKKDYAVIQKILHWVMGLLIMMDLFVAQKFGEAMEASDRLESRIDHAGLGIIIMTLFLVRVFFRIKYGAPPLPDTMPQWQIFAAKAAHFMLYFLMAGLFATGLLTASQATDPVIVFQVFDITQGNLDETFFLFVRQFHELITEIIIALIIIHIGAALYHQLIRRDETMLNMLVFWKRRG